MMEKFKIKTRIYSYSNIKRKLFSDKIYSFNFVSNSHFKNFKMQINENSQNENLIQKLTEDGGVIKKIITYGNGAKVEFNSTVQLHYIGKLDTGLVFDSSYERKEPYLFSMGENKVIKGWEIGIKSMCVGEKAQFEISSEYGYKK